MATARSGCGAARWARRGSRPRATSTAELRGLSQPLAQNTLQLYGPDCRADLGDSRCRFPLWPGVVARGTAYAAGQFVRASNPAGGTYASDFDDRIYECTSAGTTHATVQPTYEVTVGNTTTDGTAVFTAREGFTRASEVALVDNDRELHADAALDAYADGWFDEGLLVFEIRRQCRGGVRGQALDPGHAPARALVGGPSAPGGRRQVPHLPGLP